MSAPKFTPGPWQTEDITASLPDTLIYRRINAGLRHVGFAGVYKRRDSAEALANANLIAAAPELYEALAKAVEHEGEHAAGCKEYAPGFDDSRCCWVHMARAAQAKARA